jgi:hypothetical protein
MHGGDERTWRKQIQGANLHRRSARTECGHLGRDAQTQLDPEAEEVRPRRVKASPQTANLTRRAFGGGSAASFMPHLSERVERT